MYLSRLMLNPRNAQVRRELAHPYEMHRTLLNAFPQGRVRVNRGDDEAAGMLFRVEEQPGNNLIVMLVQSKTAPNWACLGGQKDARGQLYLLPVSAAGDGRPNPAVTEFDLSQKIGPDQILTFRLRANPTKRRKDNGKRVGLYDEQAQLEWLKRKADTGGFRLLRAQISRDGEVQDTIRRDGHKHDVSLFSVQFDGVMQVLDPQLACKAVEVGIGSGKGLGFGLLSLAPRPA
jgi:CRISPR system Cascade subunit CasE